MDWDHEFCIINFQIYRFRKRIKNRFIKEKLPRVCLHKNESVVCILQNWKILIMSSPVVLLH